MLVLKQQCIIDSTSISCFKNGLERTRATWMGFVRTSWSAWPHGLTCTTDPSSYVTWYVN